MRLEGKVAIVTGAGSGIGRATAHRFAEEGARLVLADIRGEYLEELEAALGAEHAYVSGDVSQEATAELLAATARERFGRIDVLVNNVGDLFIAEITETSVEDWDRLMATNLRSMFLCCKHVIPAMLEQGGGSIVNLSSISAFVGQEAEEGGPSFFAYSVTKAGARQFATNLATRYAKQGIRVNAVAPTVVRTPLVERFIADAANPTEMAAQMEVFNPMPGMPEPRDVADAVLFLASDEARFITGHVIPIDGGYTAQ